jgi:hypothetical protein
MDKKKIAIIGGAVVLAAGVVTGITMGVKKLVGKDNNTVDVKAEPEEIVVEVEDETKEEN